MRLSTRAVGLFLVLYFVAVGLFRRQVRGLAGVYDMLWLCNVALLAAGLGCLTEAPWWIACCCGAVAFSHVSWNVDVVLYGLG